MDGMDLEEEDLGEGATVDLDGPGLSLAQVCDAWTVRPPDCAACQAAATPPPHVSAATEVRRAGEQPGDPLRWWRPVWRRAGPPGTCTGTLFFIQRKPTGMGPLSDVVQGVHRL